MPAANDNDLTPFLDVRQNQLNLEITAGDVIDNKALALLASDIAVLLFIGQADLGRHILTLLSIGLYLLSLLLSVVVIWPRRYAGASVTAIDHPEYLKFSRSRLTKQLIGDTEVAIARNKTINRLRWRFCAASLIIAGVASILLGILLYFK